MSAFFGGLAFGLFLAGLLCVAFSEGRRTPASLAAGRERRHLGWIFTRRYRTLDELDAAERRALYIGRILILAGAVCLTGTGAFSRR